MLSTAARVCYDVIRGDRVRDPTQAPVRFPGTVTVHVIDTLPVWIQAAGAAITAVGLVTAGVWALILYKRGRRFMERCSIDLGCTEVSVHSKSAILVNVTVKNCGDSRVTFGTTDPAGVEVSSISTADWHGLQDSRWVQWQQDEDTNEEKIWESEDWRVREDLLEDCGGRFEPVSLEPGQDMSRSCLFIMPEEWATARIRCILAPANIHSDSPRWLATRVVVRSSINETVRPHRLPIFSDKG
jgi:hypothetical protein